MYKISMSGWKSRIIYLSRKEKDNPYVIFITGEKQKKKDRILTEKLMSANLSEEIWWNIFGKWKE